MVELDTLLNGRLKDFALEHVAIEPAKLLYRIYRDTRFFKDKTPDKTHLGATFAHSKLPRHGGAGYYFEVSHRCVGIAGGVYMPGLEELQAIRAAIAAKPEAFLAIFEDSKKNKNSSNHSKESASNASPNRGRNLPLPQPPGI